jgi:two-component system LytT family sensor kinase
MKRLFLHISFWLIYTLQDALMQYLWVNPVLQNIPENTQVWMAIVSAVVINIPKLLLTYYILLISIPQIIKAEKKSWQIVSEVLVVYVVSIVIYRVIFNYYIYPITYRNIIPVAPLFEGRRILLGIMDIGFVTGAAVTLKLLGIQLSGKEREKNLVKEKLETELKFLRNQTNPHFLFNTLNNIYALARKKSDDTADVVMKLSKLLRFMLYETQKKYIPICDEIKMLGDYLELEKIRYNQRLKISFETTVDEPAKPIAPLLLLPFVENAFKHGASETRFDSFICIELSLHRSQLNFTVKNSKENGDTERTADNIGLTNVRRQLELMYEDYTLEVKNEISSFYIKLMLNLDSHAKI